MLREKFGWPKPDLSPLRNLGTPTSKKIDEQPASPQVAKRLNRSRFSSPPRESGPPRILE